MKVSSINTLTEKFLNNYQNLFGAIIEEKFLFIMFLEGLPTKEFQ